MRAFLKNAARIFGSTVFSQPKNRVAYNPYWELDANDNLRL